MNLLLILVGKLVLLFSKTLNLGSGSTWPGHITLGANSKFVHQVLKKNPNLKIVLIAGTNGKTTTSLMLHRILEEGGLKIFRNEAGANLMNGISSTIIKNSDLTGILDFDVAIFEVDERNISPALKEIKPFAIVFLNIFRDQLDRYGEVNKVVRDWESSLLNLPKDTLLFTNGDDPKLSNILKNIRMNMYFFGIDEKLMESGKEPYDVDFTYCPNCQTKLKYNKVAYSHLGKFVCPKCSLTNPETETFSLLPQSLIGKYNIYNQNAAALVAKRAFEVSEKIIQVALADFKPAFGRQEIIKYKGRNVFVLLSKNPAGFNQSIDTIRSLNIKGNILLVLNDRIPDGRDVSWIWDVDFDDLPKNSKVFISGDRAYDMALRIKYSMIHDSRFMIHDNLKEAVESAVIGTSKNETLFILPTYSAMLETRKVLTGKKIL